jgi:UMP-CMP kinase
VETAKTSRNRKKKRLDVTCQVVFVLGGTEAGKGTQCQLLTERLGNGKEWAHLSAGGLLRAEGGKGHELGDLINAKIASGQLVPSKVTCKLIENAMAQVYDGFPRSQGNRRCLECHHVEPCNDCRDEVLVSHLLEWAKA